MVIQYGIRLDYSRIKGSELESHHLMQVNNAGVSGIELEGDVSILQEIIERDVASVFADAEVFFLFLHKHIV